MDDMEGYGELKPLTDRQCKALDRFALECHAASLHKRMNDESIDIAWLMLTNAEDEGRELTEEEARFVWLVAMTVVNE